MPKATITTITLVDKEYIQFSRNSKNAPIQVFDRNIIQIKLKPVVFKTGFGTFLEMSEILHRFSV
jgi:hypothetical protein